jgi:hypothetical protein
MTTRLLAQALRNYAQRHVSPARAGFCIVTAAGNSNRPSGPLGWTRRTGRRTSVVRSTRCRIASGERQSATAIQLGPPHLLSGGVGFALRTCFAGTAGKTATRPPSRGRKGRLIQSRLIVGQRLALFDRDKSEHVEHALECLKVGVMSDRTATRMPGSWPVPGSPEVAVRAPRAADTSSLIHLLALRRKTRNLRA